MAAHGRSAAFEGAWPRLIAALTCLPPPRAHMPALHAWPSRRGWRAFSFVLVLGLAARLARGRVVGAAPNACSLPLVGWRTRGLSGARRRRTRRLAVRATASSPRAREARRRPCCSAEPRERRVDGDAARGDDGAPRGGLERRARRRPRASSPPAPRRGLAVARDDHRDVAHAGAVDRADDLLARRAGTARRPASHSWPDVSRRASQGSCAPALGSAHSAGRRARPRRSRSRRGTAR